MNWKEFFKPTISKIILTIVLMIAFFFYLSSNLTIACPAIVGYDCGKEVQKAKTIVTIVSLISIIVWYIIACVILFAIKKFKK